MKRIFSMLIPLLLSACVSPHQGNFVTMQENKQQRMAKDAVRQLTSLYPPAKTTFCLKQPAKDSFGLALVNGLRKKGFRMVEGDFNQKANLFYVVDEPIRNRLVRVTLFVDSDSLSRAYLQQGKFLPASVWARQEGGHEAG